MTRDSSVDAVIRLQAVRLGNVIQSPAQQDHPDRLWNPPL